MILIVLRTKRLIDLESIEGKNVPVCILKVEGISITHEVVKDFGKKYWIFIKLDITMKERIRKAHIR